MSAPLLFPSLASGQSVVVFASHHRDGRPGPSHQPPATSRGDRCSAIVLGPIIDVTAAKADPPRAAAQDLAGFPWPPTACSGGDRGGGRWSAFARHAFGPVQTGKLLLPPGTYAQSCGTLTCRLLCRVCFRFGVLGDGAARGLVTQSAKQWLLRRQRWDLGWHVTCMDRGERVSQVDIEASNQCIACVWAMKFLESVNLTLR